MPDGVQLRRVRGWRLPPNTRSVARPTRWGNPFIVGQGVVQVSGTCFGASAGRYDPHDPRNFDLPAGIGLTARMAVTLYRDDLEAAIRPPDDWDRRWPDFEETEARRQDLRDALEGLRGFDLACWCPLGEPCHRDVLLEVANR